MTQEKTFKVVCHKCGKPFHIRFPLTDPKAEGSGDVVIECPYCCESMIVAIPRKFIKEAHLIRGLEGRCVEGEVG